MYASMREMRDVRKNRQDLRDFQAKSKPKKAGLPPAGKAKRHD
ncbi:MAG TPA: hypothetical protein PK843_02675 [bacterium]|nr:hypothetical protein [bacterium]